MFKKIFFLLLILVGCKTVEKIEYVIEKRVEPVFNGTMVPPHRVSSLYGTAYPDIVSRFLRQIGYSESAAAHKYKTIYGNPYENSRYYVNGEDWDFNMDGDYNLYEAPYKTYDTNSNLVPNRDENLDYEDRRVIFRILDNADRFKFTKCSYIVNKKDDLNDLIKAFKGFGLDFDFQANKYYIPYFNHIGKAIGFPEVIAYGVKRGDGKSYPGHVNSKVEFYLYDLKFREHRKVFAIDEYSLQCKRNVLRVFRDNGGPTLFLYCEGKYKTDETPFTNKCAFHSPKIFFRKTDVFVNKGHINYVTRGDECGGIYTSFGVSSKNSHECNFVGLFELSISSRVDDHIEEVLDIHDMFFDIYDECPIIEWYRERSFEISLIAVDLLEDINDDFFLDYKVNMFNVNDIVSSKEKIGIEKAESIVDEYDKMLDKIFDAFRLANNAIIGGRGLKEALREVEDTLKDDVDEERVKKRVIDIVKRIYEIYEGP